MHKSTLAVLLMTLVVALGLLLTGCSSPSPPKKTDKSPAQADHSQGPTTTTAPPCAVTVQPGQPIQQAINKASADTIICLAAGSFTENLTINKGLTLQGQGQVTLTAPGLATAVIVIASEAVIRVGINRLTLIGKGGTWDADIAVEGKVQAVFQDLQLSGQGIGLLLKDSSQVTVQNSQISKNTIGCIAEGAAQITFQDSQIVNNQGDGLRVNDSAQAIFKNTKVSGNRYSGLSLSDSAHVDLSDSTISDNGFAGLYVGNVKNKAEMTLTNTKVSSNRYAGLLSRGSTQITLNRSSISANESDGLFLEDAVQARILNSTITDNKGHGIQANLPSNLLECKGNTITKNNQGDYNSTEVSQKCS
jgi:nitrous oxidase accessory protein NosD